jgi:hypothetical protein
VKKSLNLVGHFGGTLNCVRVQGNILVCNFGPELAVFDVTVPEKLYRMGYIVLGGIVRDIYLADSYAYVAVYAADNSLAGGVYIIDLTIPARPQIVSYLVTPLYPLDIELSGTYLYLAAWDAGLLIVDVSDPATPLIIATYKPIQMKKEVFPRVWKIAAVNNFVYCQANGLYVVDVSNPTSPELKVCFDIMVDAVAISSSKGYLVANSTFMVLDVSNPTQPVLTGTYDDDNWWDYVGDLIPHEHLVLVIGDNESGEGKLRLFDVSSPSIPRQLAVLEQPGSSIAARDSYLFAATFYNGGLYVWDILEPSQPRIIGRYLAPGRVEKALLADQLLYMVGESGFYIVNLSDHTNPIGIGFFASPRSAHGLDVTGKTAYLAEGPTIDQHIATDGQGGGLNILDISDPTNPKSVGFLDLTTKGSPRDVVVYNNKAYVLWHVFDYNTHSTSKYILTIDVAQPSTPQQVDTHLIQGEPGEITLDNVTLYVGDDWLYRIKKETEQLTSQIEGFVQLNSKQSPIQVGNLIFKAAGIQGLMIFDAGMPNPI